MSPGPIFHLSFPRVPSQSGSPSPPLWELEGGCWLMSRRKEPVSVFIMRNKYIQVLKERTYSDFTDGAKSQKSKTRVGPGGTSRRYTQTRTHRHRHTHTGTHKHTSRHTQRSTYRHRHTHIFFPLQQENFCVCEYGQTAVFPVALIILDPPETHMPA